MIEGAYCDAWTLHDRLVETGVAAESIWVDARERSDKDPTAGGRTVMTRLGTRAPAVSSVRDQARLDKTCHPRIVVTDTSTEVLDIVSFVTGTPTIQRASEPILDAVVATLEGNPSIQLIEVQGHVFEGPRSQRMALSTRRAARVRDYLLGHGVAASRVVAQGYGDSQSLTCSTDLATMVRRGSSIAELRRSEAWSPSAENEYLVGKLEPYCRSGSIKNTRIAFAILKRAEK